MWRGGGTISAPSGDSSSARPLLLLSDFQVSSNMLSNCESRRNELIWFGHSATDFLSHWACSFDLIFTWLFHCVSGLYLDFAAKWFPDSSRVLGWVLVTGYHLSGVLHVLPVSVWIFSGFLTKTGWQVDWLLKIAPKCECVSGWWSAMNYRPIHSVTPTHTQCSGNSPQPWPGSYPEIFNHRPCLHL